MIRKLLFLSMLLATNVVAWAQTYEAVPGKTAEDVNDGSVVITLSGNWLDGDYIETEIGSIIQLIIDSNFTDVTFKSEEGTIVVSQSFVRQLVSGKAVPDGQGGISYASVNNIIKRLDLSDVAVTHYVGHAGANPDNKEATFYAMNDDKCTIEYLAMPLFADSEGPCSIPPYTISGMSKLDEIILPKNTKTVEHEGFAGVNVPTVKLNMGLEFIGNSAFYANSQISKEATLDVPSTVKYIGPGAFNFRNFSDIYFHSAQAPICPTGKVFADTDGGEAPFLLFGNYTGWGGITGTTGGGDKYDTDGVANRLNYRNGDSYWFTMLHFPASADVPNLDISSYKDETRVYHKVYGTIYYGVSDTKGNLEIGVPGKEQEYIAREKVWGFQGAYDFVGQETTVLSFDGQTTGLAPSGWATIPAEAVGKGVVDSGFEDTYRGLNYIWPSQTQYNRAYATVANGVNWDGVTKYRPELTQEQYELMVKDNLTVEVNGNWVTVGQDITYDEAMANAYNATLQGAVHEGEAKAWYTADEALEHNAGLDGAKQAGDTHTYSEAEAYANNANLLGAISTSDIKEPAVQSQPAVYYTDDEKIQVNNVWYVKETLIYHDAVPAVYYEDSEVIGINGTYYRVEDVVSLDGYYTDAYLQSMGIPNYNYLYSGDTKTDENGTTLYKFTGKIAIPGATVVGYQWQLDQGQRFVKEAASDAYWEVTADSKQVPSDNIKIPAVIGHDDIYYTETEVNQYNMDLDGAVKPGDEVTFTDETAAAYNAALPGAVKAGDVKETWTADAANAYNAKLTGARTADYTAKNYTEPAIEDYLRMIAFQSTRRIVFSDNAGGGDRYKLGIPKNEAANWWTLCVPFNLTKAQIDTYFGEGTHVCKFNRVDRDIAPTDGRKPYVKFYFTDDQYVGKNENDIVLQAHVPYMIRPTLEGYDAKYIAEGIPMDEYTKVPGSPEPTVVKVNIENSDYTGVDHDTQYRFIGNYDTKLPVSGENGEVEIKTVNVPQYSYIYAKKAGATGAHPYKFWFTQSANIAWGPNKCIVQSTESDRGLTDNKTFFKEEESTGAKQISVFGDFCSDENEPTDIDVIIVAGNGNDSEIIYNLNGQQLNNAPQRGVFIKNGKKYIAK